VFLRNNIIPLPATASLAAAERIERDIVRFTGPFLRYSAVILSIPDLVVYNIKYLLNFCVRYTEEEGYLNLEP
jgi:hypothetical protein